MATLAASDQEANPGTVLEREGALTFDSPLYVGFEASSAVTEFGSMMSDRSGSYVSLGGEGGFLLDGLRECSYGIGATTEEEEEEGNLNASTVGVHAVLSFSVTLQLWSLGAVARVGDFSGVFENQAATYFLTDALIAGRAQESSSIGPLDAPLV
jgi:hypothetical protein